MAEVAQKISENAHLCFKVVLYVSHDVSTTILAIQVFGIFGHIRLEKEVTNRSVQLNSNILITSAVLVADIGCEKLREILV